MKYLLIILLVIVIGCKSTLNVSNINYHDHYLQYDKVKLKLEGNDFGNITLRGYLFVAKDSLICFKFYGPSPLAIELISGVYLKDFVVYDHRNQVYHHNVLKQLMEKTGLILNRKTIEDLFTGNAKGVAEELQKLNGSVITLRINERKNYKNITIYNKPKNITLNFEFSYIDLFPKSISINYLDGKDKWNLRMQILNISNEKRNCTFNY